MLRSFLVPKMSSTMTSTISQCQMLNPNPFVFSDERGRLSSSASGMRPAERLGAADDVDVQMIHVLPADPPGVHDGAEASGEPCSRARRPAMREHPAQHRAHGVRRLGERVDMLLGDDHEVHRRQRVDVVEGEHVVVLVHLAAGNLALHDLAEDAVGHGRHPCAGRERIFSSMSRAALAALELGQHLGRPRCRATPSITRQWNHRSAVSCTIDAARRRPSPRSPSRSPPRPPS